MIVNLSVENVDEMIELSKGFSDSWNKNILMSSFLNNTIIAKGYIDKELLGYIIYSISFEDLDIDIVYVANKERRQGIGSKLIESCCADAKEKGVKKLFLEVREGNTPARNLYLKNGFKEISQRKKYYDDGETAIVLMREL